MPSQIRPNRPDVNDRFPMLGFTIKTDGEKKRYEVAVAADVSLFRPEAKSRRSRSNFYSSRTGGLQPISSGEAVYVLPAEVLARFVGQQKMYYALVTYPNGASNPEISTLPSEGSAYVNLSGLTGRSLKRVRVLPTRQGAGDGYSGGSDMNWGGDVSMPGSQPIADARTNGGSNGNPASASTPVVDYKDGFGPLPAPSTETPVTAQAASFVNPLEVVQLDYVPGNALDALRMQLDFQNRYNQWIAGVPNTSFFPHSAICQIVRDDGGAGTGFYIGPNHLLTAAHVVEGATSLTVIPGKNGGADLSGPFGNYRVWSSNWTIHPSRTVGSQDFDLAVISVPDRPPAGYYFGILEELRQSLPSSIIVCGYSAESKTHPHVNTTIDPNRQHLDGDRIRLVDDETFQYNLQTLAGASGGPVYYAWAREDEQRQMSVVELHLVGVHVAAFSGTLNNGCRLTDAKIRWIRSVMGPTLSLGTEPQPARARAQSNESYSINWDEVEAIPQPTGKSCWAASGAMVVGWRDRVSLNPETVARIAGSTTATGLNPAEVGKFANDLGLVFENPQCYTIEGFRQLLDSSGPLWVAAEVPGLHAIVVTGMYSDGAPDGSDTFVRITDPWDRITGTPGAPGAYLPTHNTGSRYILSWQDFLREYEGAGSRSYINLQILHAGGTNGRQPSRSGATGYAMEAPAEYEDDGPGIEGGIPDDETGTASAQAYSRALNETPEYPQASRFAPAAPVNYRRWNTTRTIRRVVIHINDGGTKVSGTVGWFQNPNQRNRRNEPITVSAHYVVGQDGEVVQMVRHNDQAWHAGSANRDSIGIEHIANPRGLVPSEAEYCASAALVRWLCDTYNIPIDRTHILGHSEADTRTTHTDCPNSVWNWDHYMQLVQSATSAPQAQAAALAEDTPAPELPPPPPPRARALDGGATATVVTFVAGVAIDKITNNKGDISWILDQFNGLKHPNDVVPNPMPPFRNAQNIRLEGWPWIENLLTDRISAAFEVNWQYNGSSLGNIRIANVGTNDAFGLGLDVEARIMNDSIVHPGGMAGLLITFNHRFSRPIGSDAIAVTELHLFGDGTYSSTSRWEQ